ncbi:hypothetical protein PAGU2595_012320 [Lysobacter xanthus]
MVPTVPASQAIVDQRSAVPVRTRRRDRCTSAFITAPRPLSLTVGMTPRYITPRRADGGPSRHLTARQLRRMRARFERMVLLATVSLLLGACVVR